MNKSEAVAVNVLLRACGIRSVTNNHDVHTGQDAVVLAAHLLANQAHKAIASGLGPADINAWRAHEQIVPSAALFSALEELVSLDPDMWHMQAGAFTCGEADAIAELLSAAGRPSTAALFIACHVEKDDDGDDHKLEAAEHAAFVGTPVDHP